MAVKNREPRTISARLWPADVDIMLELKEQLTLTRDGRPQSIADVISQLIDTHRLLHAYGFVRPDGSVNRDKVKMD